MSFRDRVNKGQRVYPAVHRKQVNKQHRNIGKTRRRSIGVSNNHQVDSEWGDWCESRHGMDGSSGTDINRLVACIDMGQSLGLAAKGGQVRRHRMSTYNRGGRVRRGRR